LLGSKKKSQVDMTLRSSSQDAEACLTNKTSAGGAGHTAAASIVAQDAYLDEGEWDDLVILPDRRPCKFYFVLFILANDVPF